MVSAEGSGWFSHLVQKLEAADSSKALREPRRVQNIMRVALMTTAVGMRGAGRRSLTWQIILSERANILSQYLMILRKMVLELVLLFCFYQPLPLNLGELFNEVLQMLIVIDSLTNLWFKFFRDVELARLAVLCLNQIKGEVRVSRSTLAVRFAAANLADRQRAAQQGVGRKQLSGAGTTMAVGRGAIRFMDDLSGHNLIVVVYLRVLEK